MYQKNNYHINIQKLSLGVGFGVLALYAFFIPWIHHSKESWKGYVFHAFMSCIAFSALVLPTQVSAQTQ